MDYVINQRFRKRVEEIFDRSKTVGGPAKSHFRGVCQTEHAAHWVGGIHNLLGWSRLFRSTPTVQRQTMREER